MNWTFPLIGFSLAVLMRAAVLSLLVAIRPEWSARRKRLTAASILPAITLVATLLGILFVATAKHGESQRMEDLAIAALATIGGGFTLLALVGGLVGARLASLRHRK